MDFLARLLPKEIRIKLDYDDESITVVLDYEAIKAVIGAVKNYLTQLGASVTVQDILGIGMTIWNLIKEKREEPDEDKNGVCKSER